MFTVPGRERHADTAVWPGSLVLAPDEDYRTPGFVLDTSVRAPTATTYLHGAGANAATVPGFAASVGERLKRKHHEGCLDERRWRFVPFIHETFGRIGDAASKFLSQLAGHAAACAGGTTGTIARRRGILRRKFTTELGAALAQELAERVFAYMRGAVLRGVQLDPVSTLLSPSPA
jgi:hypothetical protein